MSVLIGKGDGTFASPASYPVGNEPVSTLVANVNGDGVPALVVINKSSNTFSILGGNGDGTFKSSLDFVAGNAPLAAVAGDFYGNGHVDLAIINHASQTVSVPPGNGDGTFKAARSYAAGVQPVSVASGNLNGGRVPALVVANYCGSDPTCGTAGSVAVFLADDKGAYRLSSTYQVGAGPVSVALADVNGDRNLDIVALNRLDKTASVMLGLGDGTFRQPMTFPLAGAPVTVAVGDLNKDGKPDLAVLEDCGTAKCSQEGSLEILVGAGDGSFQSTASYPVGYSPVSIAVGAIHGDKNLDLVVANRCGKDATCQSAGTATVLIGDGTGKFTAGTEIALGNSPSSIALGNLTGSGLDLVVSRSADNAVAVLRGNGDGTFQAAVPYAVGNNPGSLVLADFNGDGKPDVAVANVADSTVSVLFGNGDGTLQPASAFAVGSGPASLTVVGGANTRHASLATANGNSASPTLGTDVTVLANPVLGSPLRGFTLVVSPTPNSTVNQGVLLTATVTGILTDPAPTGTVTFDSDPGSGPAALSDCTGVLITPGVSPSVVSTATCTTQMLTVGSPTDSLTASYSGDGTYSPRTTTDNTVTQTVSPIAATLSFLTPSPSASVTVGTSVTFTVQLAASPVTPIAPSGTFAFTINGNTSPDCPAVTLSGGSVSATCTTSSLVTPANLIDAAYSGDVNFTAAAPATVTEIVTTVAANTTLTSSQSPSSVNQTVTFTATVLAPGGATAKVQPTGSVTFTQGATALCDTGINATTHTATCNYAFSGPIPTPGATITATYSGDQNFSSGTAPTVNQVVTKDATTTSVVSTPNASTVNQPVAFTATVTPTFTAGTAVPTGSVSFAAIGPSPSVAQTPMCTETIVSGSVPVCNYPFPSAGTYTVVATYNPGTDLNFTTSASPSSGPLAYVQTVNTGSNAVVLSASPASSVVNQLVTFNATISATSGTSQPTGSVVYTDGATVLCTFGTVAVPVTFTGGIVPPCTVPLSSAATHSITATFTSSNSNFSSGASNIVPLVVSKATPVTSVASSPNPSAVNAPVTVTATVTPPFTAGTAVPGGNVVFSTTPATATPTTCTWTIGAAQLCTFTFTSNGTYNIVATYQGDSNFNGSPSSPIVQNVGAGATSVTVASSTNPSIVNQQVTLNASINFVTSGTAQPTGTVTYYDGAAALPSCTFTGTAGSPFTGGAVPACTATLYTTGTHAITASYSGDSNFTKSTGNLTPPQVVTPAATGVTVQEAVNSEPLNTPVTYSATVTPNPAPTAGSLSPTGTVTFQYVGTNGTLPVLPANLCPPVGVAAASGKATASCVALLPEAGTYAITAAYSGDLNFSKNTSTQIPQTVTKGTTTTSVVSSPNSSSVNQSVAFTATVTPLLPGGTAVPTGSVSFAAIGPSPSVAQTPMCTETIASGSVPVCNYTFTSSGTYTVVATYNPVTDPNFTTSASPSSGAGADVQTVSAGANSVVLSATPTSSVVNQPVTFNATISVTTSGTAQPTGSVVYADGATVLCTFGTLGAPVTFTGGIVPACTVPLSSAATHSITATFTTSNSNFSSAVSNTVPQIVSKATPVTSVVSSPNPSTVNAQVTATATVAPPFTVGNAVPSGNVVFTTTPATTTCTVTITAAGVVPPCIFTFTASGSYNVVATYQGDSNFLGSPSGATADVQTVKPANLTIAVKSVQGATFVNQPVTFTATLTLPNSGATPTSTVSFNDTLTGLTLCTDVPVSNLTASCAVTVGNHNLTEKWTATTHSITATYNSGDPNFSTTNSPVFSQVVTAGQATAALVSSLPVSVATQPVTFTATVTPAQTGPVVPSGSVTFTSSGTWNPAAICQAAPVAPITSGTGAGTAVATCTATFPASAVSQTISAVYSSDPNFTGPGNTGPSTSIAQTVQNFSIANSVTSKLSPTPTTVSVTLTQGYSTATSSASGTDPFNPTTVKLVVTSSGGFIDTLDLGCEVTNSVTKAQVADPSCTVSKTLSGATGSSMTYTVSASATAPIAAYTVTVTADDQSNPQLSTAAELTAYVVGVANTLTLAQGAHGTENVNFNTPTPPAGATTKLISFTCGAVVNTADGSQVATTNVSCSGPSSGVAVTGPITPVPIVISTVGSATAQLQRPGSISMAAFLGIPLLALMGWVGSRKSPRKNFLRFLGLILLLVGVSYATGCGGSFTTTVSTKSPANGLAPGNYLVQLVAADQNGNAYYAVVPLDVSSNQ